MHPVRVGILGGGQLGRMLAIAARPLGMRVIIVDPSPSCPAACVADEHIVAPFTDASAIAELASKSDVITVEIEHVNAEALAAVEDRVTVQPPPKTVAMIQDKFAQKEFFRAAGVPLGEFKSVASAADVISAAAEGFGYPLMLKARRLAYDGKGNAVVSCAEDAPAAYARLAAAGALFVEKWVPFRRELAVIVARPRGGGAPVAYPAVETVQQDSVCHVVLAPAAITGDVRARAEAVAAQAIAALDAGAAGVFGVELFELCDGTILLNEIAPRVHNSGHFSIEGSHTSQFEQHLRCITGLPLGSTAMRVPAAAMLNLLGSGSSAAAADELQSLCRRALSTPGASLHWYGKAEVRAGRKMGHVTLTGESAAEVMSRLQSLCAVPAAASALAPLVGVIMGSDSDLPTLAPALGLLRDFGVPFEVTIVSAHRTPRRLVEYATSARVRGLQVIIAAAGGAAHLPGMVAAMTPLPVIGVPVPLRHLDGVDSLHSMVQMPRGVPVAVVAIGNSTNAALLAVRILGSHVRTWGDALESYAARQETEVLAKAASMERDGWQTFLPSAVATAGAPTQPASGAQKS